MIRKAIPFASVCGALSMGWTVGPLATTVSPPEKATALDAHENYASASLLGQFRTSFSAWLWLRTDLYMHNGVELRPLSDLEKKSGRKGVGTSDIEMNQIRNEDLVITVVPPREHDFRGLFGEIERQTSAYKDMRSHGHNDPQQALPLFRLMTWIDPRFINGWTVGAITIARDPSPKGTAKALAYLEEGLRANPGNIDILSQLGYLTITRKKDLAAAARWLEQARAAAFAKGKLLESDREALETTYRWLALCYRELKESEKMAAVASEGLRVFPEDLVLARLLESAGAVSISETAKEQEKGHDQSHCPDPDHHHEHGHEH